MSIILKGTDTILGIERDATSAEQFTTWVNYTPSGSWVTNTTYTGEMRIIGDTLESRVKITLAGAPIGTPDANVLTLNLPTGLSVNTFKMLAGARVPIGSATLSDGASNYVASMMWISYDPTALSVVHHLAIGSLVNLPAIGVNASTPFTWESGDGIDIYYSIPVN